MTDTVLVALLSLIGSLGGTFGGILTGSKLLSYRVEQLEKKVEKHNQVIDRVYKLEEHNVVQDEKLSEADRRLDNLERSHG